MTVETNNPGIMIFICLIYFSNILILELENNTSDIQLPSEENILRTVEDFFLGFVVDKSIQDRVMSVEVQPPKNLHPRYASDGKRQLEKSRTNPMVIKVHQFLSLHLHNDFILVALIQRNGSKFSHNSNVATCASHL